MSPKPLISVIIPIYNVEAYLKRCVDSVLCQTYKNLEIILVDDGSEDSCGKICDEYKTNDKRIVVIHKNNGGLSDARNKGIDCANGELISFIDSDDFISEYYIHNLFTAMIHTGADMVSNQFIKYYEGDILPRTEPVNKSSIQKLSSQEYLKKLLYQDNAETGACGKIYKKILFDDIRFPVNKLYEDVATIYKIVMMCSKTAIIPNIDYYYFQRENSIQSADFNHKKMDAIIHVRKMADDVSKKYPGLSDAVKCRCFSMACNVLFQINVDGFDKEKREIWNFIKKNRKVILFDKNGRKKARLAALISYFGYTPLKFIYFLTQKK